MLNVKILLNEIIREENSFGKLSLFHEMPRVFTVLGEFRRRAPISFAALQMAADLLVVPQTLLLIFPFPFHCFSLSITDEFYSVSLVVFMQMKA